jgi:hypothetical protein
MFCVAIVILYMFCVVIVVRIGFVLLWRYVYMFCVVIVLRVHVLYCYSDTLHVLCCYSDNSTCFVLL